MHSILFFFTCNPPVFEVAHPLLQVCHTYTSWYYLSGYTRYGIPDDDPPLALDERDRGLAYLRLTQLDTDELFLPNAFVTHHS